MLSILAFAVAAVTATPQAPTVKMTELSAETPTVVYLGCQIRQTALAACQVVNNEPVEPGAAAEALKLAAGMSVPPGLGERLGGHIVVKLNIKP